MKKLLALTSLLYSLNAFAEVYDCYRKAQILDGVVKHHWLKTDTKIAGMGSLEMENRPIGDTFEAPYTTKVYIVDHSNQEPRRCKIVKHVDEDCVNSKLDIGKYLGRFSLVNNCQTFVASVLRKCSTKPVVRGNPGRGF